MEDKMTTDCEVSLGNFFGGNKKRYCVLEERSKKAEERCGVLELEVEKKKNEFELLASRFRALEVAKIAVEDELTDLKKRNGELEELVNKLKSESTIAKESERGKEVMIDLTEEDDDEEKVQLTIENKVLDCEKKKAESEVEVWKLKCRELESRVSALQDSLKPSVENIKVGSGLTEMGTKEIGLEHLQIDGNALNSSQTTLISPIEGIGDLQAAAGKFLTGTPSMKSACAGGRKIRTSSGTEWKYGGRARKQLEFGEGSPNKTIAPMTPGGAGPSSLRVIDIGDSDDEQDITDPHIPTLKIQGNKLACASTAHSLGFTSSNEKKLAPENPLKNSSILDQSDDDAGGYYGNFPCIPTPKRKRASNIVSSDDSESDDDNIPICKLKRKHVLKSCSATPTVSGDEVRECATPGRRLVRLRKREVNVEDDEREDGSESESDSLGGFIDDSSDVSDDASGESEDMSDENVAFGEILSNLGRKKDDKSNWEFQGDMQAAFGKDPVLCMKAVCALYRQQTAVEKSCKGTIISNQRGFNQCDAFRGTNLAEFLTNGDPNDDLMKSVEELQEYDPEGIELCRKLAMHYSKQLFEIYKNKEDPLFSP